MLNPYTRQDVGCYVDGARGIYSTDAIVECARNHGATIIHECKAEDHSDTCFESEFAGCEFANDYEDEANEFMEDRFPVEGCYWGRNDTADWGLWPIDVDGED
jgi:hypothetical protein